MKLLITLFVALSILENGNLLLTLDDQVYHLDYYYWGDQRVVKTWGDDGTCYWTHLLNNELTQTNCN